MSPSLLFYLKILKSWSISESPGNSGLFVSYKENSTQINVSECYRRTISENMQPMLQTSTEVE